MKFLIGIILTVIPYSLALPSGLIPGIKKINVEDFNSDKPFVDPFENQTLPCSLPKAVTREAGIHNGYTNPNARWQDFIIYMDPAYTDSQRESIINAETVLANALPCVEFWYYEKGYDPDPSEDYVHIIKGTNNGCWSWIGRLRQGRQNMHLQSPSCISQGTIIHEMVHALGFHHEHVRSDRDNYVNINWGNIESGQEYNFEMVSGRDWDFYGTSYNIESIMQYDSRAFSRNGEYTITKKNGGYISPSNRLQGTDIQRLRNMYGC